MKFTLENSKRFSDSMLDSRAKILYKIEQRAATEMINVIIEVERRRLHLKWGYSSLFAWLTKGIGFAEASAFRRIESARLLRSVPSVKSAVEAKLESGALNLTTLSSLQTAIRQHEKRSSIRVLPAKKLELLQAIENKSARETQKIIAEEFPDLSPYIETKKYASGDITKYTIPFTKEQMALLERVKELSSHSNPGATPAELIAMLAKEYIRRKDPLQKKPRQKSPKLSSQITSAAEVIPKKSKNNPAPSLPARAHDALEKGPIMDVKTANTPRSADRSPKPRIYIKAELKRAVFKRDDQQCTYTDPRTGKRCEEKSWLEIDHIWPVAKGGMNELRNLRVLCRAHNQYEAIRHFGFEQMKSFSSQPKL